MSGRRGRGREKSLQELMGSMRNKGTSATAVAEEAPPAEPVDDSWPPADPVDDDTTAVDAPNLTVVPEPREEETAPEPEAAPEPVAEAEPEAEPESVVEAEVVDEPEADTAAVEAESAPEPVVDAEVVDDEPEADTAAVEPTAQVEETGKVLVLRDTGGESELEVQRQRLLPKLPEMAPPPPDLAPAQQLAHYEDILSGANRNLGLVVDLAKREWVRYVGWSLGPVRDLELWNKDPEREFASFDAYCREQWAFSGDYANKQIRALPVINVLRDVTAKELKEGPLRVLVRVYTSHGDQAVLDTWFRAETHYGSTAAAKLEQAARDLNFIKAGQKDDDAGEGGGGDGEDGEADKEPQIAPKLTPKERAETWLKPLGETVATDDTKELSATVRELRRLLDRYELQLKERQSEERRARREAKKAEEPAPADSGDADEAEQPAEADAEPQE
ncbi:hypothetical protein ACIRPQ_29035 [Streptomyces sp. NPDC101213]|uniref:hypothetical protein n=1 Tax=Streptomyces sp. NPDC101213 TaxID=3366130 RepID=UPI00382C2F3F